MRLPGVMGSLAAGVAAAIGASVCCVLPLALLGLGIGGAWVASLTALEPARPFFVAASLACLGLGFVRLYRTPASGAPGEACAVPRLRARQRATFWIVAALTLALLVAPWAGGLFI